MDDRWNIIDWNRICRNAPQASIDMLFTTLLTLAATNNVPPAAALSLQETACHK
jgi:hypothetical protein